MGGERVLIYTSNGWLIMHLRYREIYRIYNNGYRKEGGGMKGMEGHSR